jgi:hypothetical protein
MAHKTPFYLILKRLKLFYILNFNRYQNWFRNKLFGRTALTGYIIQQYSITIYTKHEIYLMMVLSGRNMSVNLQERMDEVVSRPVTCKAAVKIVLCVYTHTHTHIYKVINKCNRMLK